MADLIDRQAAIEWFTHKENEFCERFRPSIRPSFANSIARALAKLPAVDAVEVQAIEKWLYEIAMNNVGQPVEDMAAACEIIISRLDGLRRFAKERREENAAD